MSGENDDPEQPCVKSQTCPAPTYYIDGVYPGGYVQPNNTSVDVGSNTNQEDFGLDDYEPTFFYPASDWNAAEYEVRLFIPIDSFNYTYNSECFD